MRFGLERQRPDGSWEELPNVLIAQSREGAEEMCASFRGLTGVGYRPGPLTEKSDPRRFIVCFGIKGRDGEVERTPL